ncbi:AsmA family protein [Billgrantia diversa]|uniref:AsmA family protein n=1 Tax=Halomonas sp. MCCC 1A13316 TaxID=2733487 RepID=UPI0018A61A2A|nr:AsmA family protein [Halomonas sp. MCCC 1A13316]QOR37658.1 AsmA family protein [Halomonas sp. MCCC 1A13316]
MNKVARLISMTVGALLLVLVAAALFLETGWFRGWLEDQASEQLGRKVTIAEHGIDWGLPLTLRLNEVRVANASWAEDPMARLEELSVTLDVGALLQGKIELERVDVNRPEMFLLRREDGTTNIDDLLEGEPTEEQDIPLWPKAFNIDRGRLVFRDSGRDVELDMAFSTPGESVEELSADIRGEGHVQGDAVAFQGVLHLEMEERRGAIEAFQGRLGESRLHGSLALDLGRDVPRMQADLDVDVLDLNRWSELFTQDERQVAAQERPLMERLERLRSFEAEVVLSIGLLRAAERTLHDVVVRGALREGELAIDRLQAREPLGEGEERSIHLQGRLDAASAEDEAASVEQGRLSYRDTARKIEIEASFEAPGDSANGAAGDQRLSVQGEGRLQEDSVAFEGLLRLDVNAWRGGIDGFEASIGESHLEGSLEFDLGRDSPWLAAELEGDALDLDRWGLFEEERAREAPRQEEAQQEGEWDRQVVQVLQGLEAFEGEFDLALGQLHYAGQTLYDLALDATLEEGRLSIARLQARQQLDDESPRSLSLQGWLEVDEQRLVADLQAQLDRIDLTAALAPLGFGPLGTLDGNLNTRVVDGGLLFENTALDYRASHWGLALSFTADTRTEGVEGQRVHLVGQGSYEQEQFDFDLLVGPLLDLTNPDAAYPISGELASGDTRLWIDGSAVQPFALESLEGRARLEGPSPAELTELTGISLPELPPYRVSGYVRYRDDLLNVDGLEGTFGDSDVAGDVRIRFGERPKLWATLESQQLEADDLLPILGMSPETGTGETVSPEQQQWEAEERRAGVLFPDREWNLEALRNTDIVLDYEAAEVQAKRVPFNDMAVSLELDRGVMTVDPLQLGLGGGEVRASWRLDARKAAIEGVLQLALDQINLKALLDEAGLPDVARDSLGVFGGHGDFSYRGGSMHEVMAGLDGELELAMSQGWLDIIAAELLPLNVANALVAALAGEEQVQLECTYVRFLVEEGLAELENFFMATEIAHFEGAGAINLETEKMDMAFQGHNLDPTLFTGNSPVELKGSLREPEVNVVTEELIARGALSLLGALVAPPLAILPWVDPGGGEQVGMGCEQALSAFKE